MKIRCRIGYHKLGPAEHLQDSINSRTCEDCGKPFLYDGEVLIGDFVLPPIANQHSLTIQDWLDQVNESAPTKLELIEWKPIDQAKKDGTRYLVYRRKGIVIGAWDVEHQWWMDVGDGWPLREPNFPEDPELDPTHFAELPLLPELTDQTLKVGQTVCVRSYDSPFNGMIGSVQEVWDHLVIVKINRNLQPYQPHSLSLCFLKNQVEAVTTQSAPPK